MFFFIKKILITMLLLIVTSGYINAIPPKPGPNFVWIPKQKTAIGIVIPAHWKYVGKKNFNKSYHKRYKIEKKRRRGFRGRR